MLHIMNKIAVRALWVFILITVACSVEFKAQASDYIGTVKLRMTGKMAKNNMYGPWVYSEPIDKAPTNVFVTYTIYDDKILDENGSVYQCVDKGNVVNGVSTSVYKVDETTYLLRIGKELIVILEEGDNDFYLELAGVNGPQSLLSQQYLSAAQTARQQANTSVQQAQTSVQQSSASGWQQLADALAQMGNSINQALGNYAANKSNPSRQNKPHSTSQSATSSQSSTDVWTPTYVLEIHTGMNIRTTHQFHNWYKRFYGNRWCLFLHKGGTKFHVATVNNDRSCAGYDVSRYAFKAIDPTGTAATGKRYYYFN